MGNYRKEKRQLWNKILREETEYSEPKARAHSWDWRKGIRIQGRIWGICFHFFILQMLNPESKLLFWGTSDVILS